MLCHQQSELSFIEPLTPCDQDLLSEVVNWVAQHNPDAILMDIMIPNQDGVECMKKIRQFSMVPIVMMTAKVSEADRLRGIEFVADDYVRKPFSAAELVMRVKAILRRCASLDNKEEKILVDEELLLIKLKDQILPLTKVEFDIFALLYKALSCVFSRLQILDFIQPDNFDISDRVIDSHIKNIRKKIKQIGISSKLVGSVYGAGYRFDEQQIDSAV